MDPHVWLDFQYDQIILAKIADILSEMDPQNKLHYQKNALSYQKKLQKLDIQYMAGLKDCDQKIIVLGGHNAFGYMARRYHLKLISLYGLSPNARPGPKQIAEIVDMAKENNIKTIFYETFVNDQLAQVLAREIGAVTMALNTGANLTMDGAEYRCEFDNGSIQGWNIVSTAHENQSGEFETWPLMPLSQILL
jgi:zinc transport system substrate-binding protein